MVKKVRHTLWRSYNLSDVNHYQAYVIGRSDGHYMEMLDKVHGIVFLSTPHQGSVLAHTLNNILAATLGASQKVYISELEAGSTSLQDLNEQFRGVCESLQLVSLYETLPTRIAGLKRMVITLPCSNRYTNC